MKNIDFLPAHFHKAIRRRRVNRRNAALAIALAVGLTGLHTLNHSRLRTATAALQSLQMDDLFREQQQARLEMLTVRKEVLSQREAVISELDDNTPCDVILAEITRLLLEGMAIRSLSMEVDPRVPEEGAEIDPVLDRGPTHLVLRGEASSDVQVGVFVGKLSSCPLFDGLQLKFSRATTLPGGLDREFELAFAVNRIALNRQG